MKETHPPYWSIISEDQKVNCKIDLEDEYATTIAKTINKSVAETALGKTGGGIEIKSARRRGCMKGQQIASGIFKI